MRKAEESKKDNHAFLVIFKTVNIVSFFVGIIFFYFLGKLNIIPTNFFVLAIIIFSLIEVVSFCAITWFCNTFKIFSFFIVCVIAIVSILGIYYAQRTDNFLYQSFHSNKIRQSAKYYVVALKDGSTKSLDDIDSIAYYENTTYFEMAYDALKSKFLKLVELSTFKDMAEMYYNLQSNKIKAILVDQASYELIFQVDKNIYKEKFSIIYEYVINFDQDYQTDGDQEQFNIYVGGNDFTNSLVDFNMIITINTKTRQVLMTGIPRDYYIPVYGFGGRRDTLSYMGARGIETSYKSLQDFLNIKIDYFVKVKTDSLVSIIDEVGGISYCSDTSYTTTHSTILNSYDDSIGQKLQVKKGCQNFNGIEALTVARERKAFAGGDRQRQINCQKIIMAIIEKLKNFNTLTNYNNILEGLNELYQTSIPREVISELIKGTLSNGIDWEFKEQYLNGTDTKDYVHLTNLRDFVMYPDAESVDVIRRGILETLNNAIK